jgi:hypothetical protein
MTLKYSGLSNCKDGVHITNLEITTVTPEGGRPEVQLGSEIAITQRGEMSGRHVVQQVWSSGERSRMEGEVEASPASHHKSWLIGQLCEL